MLLLYGKTSQFLPLRIIIHNITMSITNKRLFVGNIPPDISESDIEQEFSSYGNVTAVEIKQKRDCLNENPNRFAFINLDIDTWGLNKCIQSFSEQQWKGYYLKVALAKESFLEQLQRERLEAKALKKNNVGPDLQSDTFKSPIKPIEKTAISNHINQKKIFPEKQISSSSEDSSESENEVVNEASNHISNTIQQKKIDVRIEPKELGDNDFIIKSNKHNSFLYPEQIKIPSFGARIDLKKEKPIEKVLTPRALLAEQKRKQSLIEKKEQYDKQKLLLQKSFLKIDAVPKNKIVFKEKDDIKIYASQHNRNKSNEGGPFKRKKKSLFDENEEDEVNYEFDVKEQYKGNKGQKLLEMQSRFSNDKRFEMDMRFLHDETEQHVFADNDITNEGGIDEEKRNQYQILEDVLGKNMDFGKEHMEKNHFMKSMFRYDPIKPDHSKFINIETKNDMKKKKRKSMIIEEVKDNEPSVSKEKFYAVSGNLKESMKDSGGFSLLSMFGKEVAQEDADNGDDYAENKIERKTNKRIHPMDIQNNPFHYDSSDSDEEMNGDIRPKNKPNNFKFGHMSTTGVWRENFFFKNNDERILEGVKCFTNFSVTDENKKSFDNTRRELKQIIKYKVLNNLRNARPFKNKLGGHRISRNLKRI